MNAVALRSYLDSVAAEPSRFGGLDCVRFACEALYAGWGRDVRPLMHYDDRRTACARLRDAGGLAAAFDEHWPRLAPADLEAGDIAHLPGPSVGIVLPTCIAIKWRSTIIRVGIEQAEFGWRPWAR